MIEVGKDDRVVFLSLNEGIHSKGAVPNAPPKGGRLGGEPFELTSIVLVWGDNPADFSHHYHLVVNGWIMK